MFTKGTIFSKWSCYYCAIVTFVKLLISPHWWGGQKHNILLEETWTLDGESIARNWPLSFICWNADIFWTMPLLSNGPVLAFQDTGNREGIMRVQAELSRPTNPLHIWVSACLALSSGFPLILALWARPQSGHWSRVLAPKMPLEIAIINFPLLSQLSGPTSQLIKEGSWGRLLFLKICQHWT